MNVEIDNDLICSAVNKYSDTVLRIAFYHTQNNADAEDLTQDVFLALLKGPLIKDETHLKAWLIRVVINKCRDLKKSAASRKNTALDAAMSKFHFNENDFEVMQSVSELKPLDRDIVYLHYFEGYSAKEIGGIVNKKEDAIFTRLKRIRLKLKNMLEDK